METKLVNQKSVEVFMELYDMHTQLFYNVIEDISDEDANNRLNTKANHPSWLAGSLVQERFELANILGKETKSTFDDLFHGHKGIQDNTLYPTLKEYKSDWERISPLLKDALLNANEEQLEREYEMEGMKFTVYDMVTMLMHREPYCIGQLALYRRLLGYSAMKYPY